MRNHAQVFAADQHAGGRQQGRQFAHGLAPPVFVVAIVEEVVVEPVECRPLAVAQGTVRVGELRRNARMIETALHGVLDEKHLVDEPHQTVANPVASVVALSGEQTLDLALRIDLLAQGIAAAARLLQILRAHLLGRLAEEIIEHVVIDIGLGVARGIEPEPGPPNLLLGEGQSRIEVAQQTVYALVGNLPDTEKAQNVVDPVGIEILGHLAETGLPPGIAVLGHALPVVGGQPPVLTQHGEVVGRCSGLRIHVEEVGIDPGVAARAADADGNIALQDHAVRMGVVADLTQLTVQMVLHEVDLRHLRVAIAPGRSQLPDRLRIICSPLAPATEIGCTVPVAQGAEGGIGPQPRLVAAEKLDELLRSQRSGTLFGEQLLQIGGLRGVDPLVIHLRKGVELLAQLSVFRHGPLVGEASHSLQPQELRMERIGRIGVVGIGVLPGSGHRGVVDRQDLNHLESGRPGPVYHLLQIVELAHAEALLRPERKDRNGYAGSAPGGSSRTETVARQRHARSRLGQAAVPVTVGPGLPLHDAARSGLADDEFIGESRGELRRLDAYAPDRETGIAHHEGPLRVPAAQLGGLSRQCQHLVRLHLGRLHLEKQRPAGSRHRSRTLTAGENALRKGRRVERALRRPVRPAVDAHALAQGSGRSETMGLPPLLAQGLPLVGDDPIAVFERGSGRQVDHQLPLAVRITHSEHGVELQPLRLGTIQHHAEVLAPAGIVLYSENNFHLSIWF